MIVKTNVPRFAFYAKKDCAECPPVQDFLDDEDVKYDFYWVMPSADPDFVEVWTADNKFVAKANQDQLPASPALYDRRTNVVLCGQTLIRRHIETLRSRPWA